MATAPIYTPRQEDLLAQIGKQYGFARSDLTSVSFQADVPVSVTYVSDRGTFTRSTYEILGPLLTAVERTGLQTINAASRDALSTAFLNSQALLALTPLPRATDYVASLGRSVAETVALTGLIDPRNSRLAAAGLVGAGSSPQFMLANSPQVSFSNQDKEDRVRISDPSKLFINGNNPVLKPLVNSDYQVIFPYTPSISVEHSANYDEANLTHSNYTYYFYQNSPTATININANFSAKDEASADYVVAVQHFFRSVTKMFYGNDSQAGLPPPVLRLDGHGNYQFSSVPVVVRSFQVTLPTDVDYITSSNDTRVPVMQEFSLQLNPLYSRSSISNDFSLRDFAAGKLLGQKGGKGGFI